MTSAASKRLTSGTVSGSRSRARIAGSTPPNSALFGAMAFGAAADDGKVGQGEHRERDMAVPAHPGAHPVVVQSHFTLGLLEQALNGPARTGHTHQFGQACALRRMGR